MKNKLITWILIMCLVQIFSPVFIISPADAAEKSLSLEVIKGPVQMKDFKDSKWNSVGKKALIWPGYYVNIGKGGAALLHYPDGSTSRLFEKSMIEVMDTDSTGRYNIKLVGNLLATTTRGNDEESYYVSNGYQILRLSDSVTKNSAVEALEPRIVPAAINQTSSITGIIKEVFPETQTFTVQVDTDTVATVQNYPTTITDNGFNNYITSGNPSDLCNVENLTAGEPVVVYGNIVETNAVSIDSDIQNQENTVQTQPVQTVLTQEPSQENTVQTQPVQTVLTQEPSQENTVQTQPVQTVLVQEPVTTTSQGGTVYQEIQIKPDVIVTQTTPVSLQDSVTVIPDGGKISTMPVISGGGNVGTATVIDIIKAPPPATGSTQGGILDQIISVPTNNNAAPVPTISSSILGAIINLTPQGTTVSRIIP